MEIKNGTLENLDEMIELADSVFRPKEKSMRLETPIMYSKENIEKGNTFIIVEDKKIVSFVGMVEEEIVVCSYKMKIGEIGNVCTHPDYRGKGYASILLQKAIEKAKNDNLSYLMISGGRSLYKRIGAVSLLYYFYQIKGRDKKLDFKIRRYKDEMYKDCIKIYQKEPIRFLRKKDFSGLFSLYNGAFKRKVMGGLSKIWVIEKEKEILAYWAEGERKGVITIGYNREFAGLRKFLFKAWINKKGIRNIFIPLWDRESHLFLGKENEIREMGTVLLINPEILFNSLDGFFKERGINFSYKKEQEKFILKADKEEKSFENLSKLSEFLFCFSGKFPEGIWKEFLPIPIPPYGLNYA
ncbi:MAG: GNAT family N-acetyltransferase [Candidatus Omnitrophica bacterium]|nr:GNAT family N-acetyltransferase [Candidatus Omnitrophota bacterium]MCM8802454.1 GNAT family N-acetyltransferase [Candidatus Omnitrophota bacterium]